MKNLLIKVYNYFKSFFVKPLPKKKMGYYAVLEEGRIVMNDKPIVGIIVNEESKGGPFQPDFNAKKPFHKKFRVWNGFKFLDNSFVTDFIDKNGKHCYYHKDWGFHVSENPFAVIQWSTGLKDKNGKEIYEGDIIRFQTKFDHGEAETFEEEVYYDEQYACVCFGRDAGFTMFDSLVKSSIEVIGNIFEKKHE